MGKTGFVYTVTFPSGAGNVDAITVDSSALTGGTITVNVATTTSGMNSTGKYAAFDSSKSDGRQTLARDKVGILNQTIKQFENTILGGQDSQNDIHGLIIGGRVWRERVMVDGTNQPTWANLQTALPELKAAKS